MASMQVACTVAVIVLTVVFTAKCDQSTNHPHPPNCTCHPVPKEFNETIIQKVTRNCRKCYVFSYNFTLQQDWAANICVYSSNVSHHYPLLVVVRESLSVMSFQVPQRYEESSFDQVCHTLCPIANYFDSNLNHSIQNIFVEITTRSPTPVEFEVNLSIDDTFIIVEEQSMTVNITPSQPRVLQYNMDKNVSAVRVEAQSPDNSCMVLSIQDIQCPFYDSEKTVEHSGGFYQTLTKQSGIAITKKTFPMGRVYIVLILKPTSAECMEEESAEYQFSKQVTVTVVSDGEHFDAVYWSLGLYVGFFVVVFLFCCCFFMGALITKCCVPTIIFCFDYLTWAWKTTFWCYFRDKDSAESETVEMGSGGDGAKTQILLYVADLAKKEDEDLNRISKAYSWNILTIAIFYGLPVVQLVFINQRIVNLTGNQDLCYYNYLCSYELWGLSDFNHFYSNIGYVILGILFLLLVYRRESLHTEFMKKRPKKGTPQFQEVGIPPHFGLFYAMGWALIMEGVLSASYHVCPNKANFQFDTTFMYVITTVCMLKLYQARHPDITAKSHTTYMILSIFVIIGAGELLQNDIIVWVLFAIAHMTVTLLASAILYYNGCCSPETAVKKSLDGSGAPNWQPLTSHEFFRRYLLPPKYKCRFSVIALAVLGNIGADLYGLIKQPHSFADFILYLFIGNLVIYLLFYYIPLKCTQKEKMGCVPIIYLVLSLILWPLAIFFFKYYSITDWELLLTLDDGLKEKPRSEIIVF